MSSVSTTSVLRLPRTVDELYSELLNLQCVADENASDLREQVTAVRKLFGVEPQFSTLERNGIQITTHCLEHEYDLNLLASLCDIRKLLDSLFTLQDTLNTVLRCSGGFDQDKLAELFPDVTIPLEKWRIECREAIIKAKSPMITAENFDEFMAGKPGFTGCFGVQIPIPEPIEVPGLGWIQFVERSGFTTGNITVVIQPNSYVKVKKVCDVFPVRPDIHTPLTTRRGMVEALMEGPTGTYIPQGVVLVLAFPGAKLKGTDIGATTVHSCFFPETGITETTATTFAGIARDLDFAIKMADEGKGDLATLLLQKLTPPLEAWKAGTAAHLCFLPSFEEASEATLESVEEKEGAASEV